MSTQMFRATSPLFVGQARAHDEGEVLSVEQVNRGGWHAQVEDASPAEVQAAGGPPAKSASKDAWVEFATSPARGSEQLSREEATEMTRDLLAEQFSS